MQECKKAYTILLNGIKIGKEYGVSKWQAIDRFATRNPTVNRGLLKAINKN